MDQGVRLRVRIGVFLLVTVLLGTAIANAGEVSHPNERSPIFSLSPINKDISTNA